MRFLEFIHDGIGCPRVLKLGMRTYLTKILGFHAQKRKEKMKVLGRKGWYNLQQNVSIVCYLYYIYGSYPLWVET